MKGYFELLHTRRDGSILADSAVRINTETGVILNCHPKANVSDVKRICAIARQTPDYPCDLTAWRETSEGKVLEWSARLFWRESNGN